jgi:hypothetical protein
VNDRRAAVAAVALFVAGVVVWRMTSTPARPVSRGIGVVDLAPPHRRHPLRAELLWAASALFAVAAIGIWLRRRHRRGSVEPASGFTIHAGCWLTPSSAGRA